MASSSSPLRQVDHPDEMDALLNSPDVLDELGRLADEADSDGGVGDVDGETFAREFLTETMLMAAARGVSVS